MSRVAPAPDNPLAPVLAEMTRTLSQTRLIMAAERDFTAWLQTELCRARTWTVLDVLHAWRDTCDARAALRATIRQSPALPPPAPNQESQP